MNATEQFQQRLMGNIYYLTNRGDPALQITVPDAVDVDCVVTALRADGYRVTPRKGSAKHCTWNYLTITWG